VLRQWWARFLVLGLLASVGAVWLDRPGRAIVLNVLGWTACAIGVRVAVKERGRAGRPWLVLSIGGVLLLLAGIATEIQAALTGVSTPFPSVGELFAMAGYVVLILGELDLVRLRQTEPDRDNLIDSLIVAVGTGVVIWAVVMAPFVRDDTFSIGARVANVVFVTLSLVIVAVTARLAVGPGARTPSYYLLAAAVGLLLLVDLVATLESTGQISGDWFVLLAAPIYVVMGGAALHPSHSHIADPVEQDIALTWRRIALLAAALLVAPAVLVSQVGRGREIDLPVVVTGSVLLSILVLVRLSSLVWARERAASQERSLRRTGTELVAARSSQETNETILAAVTEIAHGLPVGRASILRFDGDRADVVASEGIGATTIVGRSRAIDTLPEEVRRSLESLDMFVGIGEPIDLPPRDRRDHDSHLVVIPLVSQGVTRGAIALSSPASFSPSELRGLRALAAQVSLAIESAALAEDLHRRRGERRFRALVENSSDLIVVFDEWGRGTFASPVAERLLGRPESFFLGPMPVDFIHPIDQPRFASLLRSAAERGVDDPSEVRFLHGDGSYRWFEVRVRDLRSEPEIAGLVLNARDITDRKAAEERLARSEARFRALVQNSSDVVAVIDEQGFFTYVSPAVEPMLGYRNDELVGTNVLRLLPADEVGSSMRLLGSLTEETFSQLTLELRLRDRRGEWHHVDVTISDLRSEPAVQGIVLNGRDVTVRRALEEDIEHRSLHDELTGLVNRVAFASRVARALGRTEPRLDQVGVLFIDLDDFKEVNDSLGHHVGDRLLVAVAERVRGCLRVADVAARLGGDEFAVLVEDIYGESEVVAVADRIIAAVGRPYVVDGHEITVSASVGIAVDHDRSMAPDALLRSADVAMYLAKETGKARHAVFREDAHGGAFDRLELKASLLRAIHEGELVLHYQPIIELRSGRVVGFEALVRWLHPTRGLLGPGAFIPLAEETGLVVPLGSWVLREACRQLAEWQRVFPAAAGMKVSVNLSVRQLEQGDIVGEIGRVLQDAHLGPDRLTLEITESLVMHDADSVRGRLVDLRALGVSLAVDDFGTGYSSLGYIQRFPVDVIKIDRSFIEQMDSDGAGVVRTIIDLAAGLDADVVAEGIEEPAQHQALITLGCVFGQGFLFSRPVPAEEFVDLLRGDVAQISVGAGGV